MRGNPIDRLRRRGIIRSIPAHAGEPVVGRVTVRHVGSIPAHAGEPSSEWRLICGKWVYPRACGGTMNGTLWNHCRLGLSPRMRGNHDATTATTLRDGSIPAHAGEPNSRPGRYS